MKQWLDHSSVRARKKNVVIVATVVAAAGLLFAIAAMNGLSIPCPIKALTGLDCPGCGNTRAVLSLLRLDIAASFSYNLLWPLEFAYIAWACVVVARCYVKTGRATYALPWLWIDVTVGATVVAWGVVRNVLRVQNGEPLFDSGLAMWVQALCQRWI